MHQLLKQKSKQFCLLMQLLGHWAIGKDARHQDLRNGLYLHHYLRWITILSWFSTGRRKTRSHKNLSKISSNTFKIILRSGASIKTSVKNTIFLVFVTSLYYLKKPGTSFQWTTISFYQTLDHHQHCVHCSSTELVLGVVERPDDERRGLQQDTRYTLVPH